MALKTNKTECGEGGKRGHSKMTNWDEAENIKSAGRKIRRSKDDGLGRSELS